MSDFDRIAPFYRLMEFLSAGKKLQRCRVAFLDEIKPPRRILIAGEGHGRFLPACALKFPAAEITVIDSSARMLEIAVAQTHSAQVTFHQVDIRKWQAPLGKFDLIVTHFFLDCFTAQELPPIIETLAHAATNEAVWLLADFQIAPHGLARLRSRLIVGLLYRFFRIVSGLHARQLVPPDDYLQAMGFSLQNRQTYEWGLLKSECWIRTPPKTPAPPP